MCVVGCYTCWLRVNCHKSPYVYFGRWLHENFDYRCLSLSPSFVCLFLHIHEYEIFAVYLVIFHNQNLDNGPFLFMHKISHSVLVWPDFLNNNNVLCKSSLKDMTVWTMCPLLWLRYAALLFGEYVSSTLPLRFCSVPLFLISKNIHHFVFLKTLIIFLVLVWKFVKAAHVDFL